MSLIIDWCDQCQGVEHWVKVKTPVAELQLTLCGDVIVNADWISNNDENLEICSSIQNKIDRYYQEGDNAAVRFRLLRQGTVFQNKVWQELSKIPFADTISYSNLAKSIDSSPRAVGNACRDNPYPLFIPCHRVVAVNGLGGYCGKTEGDAILIKVRLLELEAQGKV